MSKMPTTPFPGEPSTEEEGLDRFAGNLQQRCFQDAPLHLGNLWVCEGHDGLIAYTM